MPQRNVSVCSTIPNLFSTLTCLANSIPKRISRQNFEAGNDNPNCAVIPPSPSSQTEFTATIKGVISDLLDNIPSCVLPLRLLDKNRDSETRSYNWHSHIFW
jgi:hypothetical protein